MGPMIPKEMKYNLHYGDVRGDVLPPQHSTNTGYSVVKINFKKILKPQNSENSYNVDFCIPCFHYILLGELDCQ